MLLESTNPVWARWETYGFFLYLIKVEFSLYFIFYFFVEEYATKYKISQFLNAIPIILWALFVYTDGSQYYFLIWLPLSVLIHLPIYLAMDLILPIVLLIAVV